MNVADFYGHKTDATCVFWTDEFCQSQEKVFLVIKKHFKTIWRNSLAITYYFMADWQRSDKDQERDLLIFRELSIFFSEYTFKW